MILDPISKKDLLQILKKILDLKLALQVAGLDDANELLKATKRTVVKQFVTNEINKYLKEE